MSNSLTYKQEYYVVLETNQPEQFLTEPELLHKLQQTLQQIPADTLPPDTHRFVSIAEKAQFLLETTCQLDMGPGNYLQWYGVRLEK